MNTIKLVDTYHVTDDYPRGVFRRICTELGLTDTDENYYDWAYQQAQGDLEEFQDNMKYSDWADVPVVVEGTLGLWWGNPKIEQHLFDSIFEAMSVCLSSSNDIIIRKTGNHLEMDGMHHDGTNRFKVTFLTPCGENRFNRNGHVSTRNQENYKKLPEYLY